MSPSVVKSIPGANATRLWSLSAARINVSNPTIPNWSITIPDGIFVTVPANMEYLFNVYKHGISVFVSINAECLFNVSINAECLLQHL